MLACPLDRKSLSKATYCAWPDKATKIHPPPDKKQHDIQDFDGVKIDVALINGVEDNYGGGYVPWGPGIRFRKDEKTGEEKLLPTSRGKSGVTFGRGVDLGQLETADQQENFEAELDGELEEAGMPAKEREAQLARLRPFYAKKGADACAAFSEAKQKGTHTLDPRTIEAMNHSALEVRAAEIRDRYNQKRNKVLADYKAQVKAAAKKKLPPPPEPKPRGFDELSTKEKTVLMSAYYQEGSLQKQPHTRALVKALMEGDAAGADKALEAKSKLANQHFADRAKQELSYFRAEAESPKKQ